MAALNVNGKTTWSFAGWTPDHFKYELKVLRAFAMNKNMKRRFKGTDVIIIDEISMVENLHFERLSAVMQSGRGRSEPFGGGQVIVTGDFCQLPPVDPFQYCLKCGCALLRNVSKTLYTCPKACRGSPYREVDKWAFCSNAWRECNFTHVHLETVHRQKDASFINMLQKCRLGYRLTPDEIASLMRPRSITHSAARLFPTREEVRQVNSAQFQRLETPAYPYNCRDNFIWRRHEHPHLKHKRERKPDRSLSALDGSRLERLLELKKGMRAVLLVNLDLSQGLCNGSQGIICGFVPHDLKDLPTKRGMSELFQKENDDGGDDGVGLMRKHASMMEYEIRAFMDQIPEAARVWPVVRFNNGVVRAIYPECQVNELGDNEPYSLLSRTQIPLTAAWALTMHKSQGMTLDQAIVDLTEAWEEGQVYVALSRVRSLDGLRIEGTSQGLKSAVGGNVQVMEFFWKKFPAVMKRVTAEVNGRI